MVRIISVSAGKGGVGKTVVTANLGVALASHYKKKVVAIDCNLTNPHLGLMLGMFSSWPVTLNDVLRDQAPIEKAICYHPSGLGVVPASFEWKDIRRISMARLRSRIRSSFEKMGADIVLLDSSPGLTIESLMTLRCSDEVIFVATPHIPSVIDITKSIRVLKRLDAKPLGVVLNRRRGKKYEMREEEVEKFTSLPLMATIPEDESVLISTNFKFPVVSSFPGSQASKALVRLGGHIIQETVPIPREVSLWKRILSLKRF